MHKAPPVATVFALLATLGRAFRPALLLPRQTLTATGPGGDRQHQRFGDSSLAEHTLNNDSIDAIDDNVVDKEGPKAKLLQEISGSSEAASLFGSSSNVVEELIDDLSGCVLPLEPPSKWKLLYTTAPDVLGFRGGPLSQLVSITQTVVSLEQFDLALEYKPSDNVMQLAGSFVDDVQNDRLVQTVQFGVTSKPSNKFDLEITGTTIESSRLASVLSTLPQPSLQSPVPLPFVGFLVVFNDGSLRVDRSVQGNFLSVYKRIPYHND